MADQPYLHDDLQEAHGELKPYNDMEMDYPNYPHEEWNESNDPDEDPNYEPGEIEIGEETE